MVVVVDVPRLIYHRLVWLLPRVRIFVILDLSGSLFRTAHIFIDTFISMALLPWDASLLPHQKKKNVARRLCSVHKLTFALLLDW